jgi:hypothetical protein
MKILLDDLKIENPCEGCSDVKNMCDGCERLSDYLQRRAILREPIEVDIDEALRNYERYTVSIYLSRRENKSLKYKTFSQFLKEYVE